jgi:hypothetical protein
MGRFFVLCLVFLSLLSFPVNASALGDSGVTGYLWLNALSNAQSPANGPPTSPYTAKFTVSDINFDSRRVDNPQTINFNAFLTGVQWLSYNPQNFDPTRAMFTNPYEIEKEGIFFQFEWDMTLPKGTLPFRITYDDGFFLLLSTGDKFPVTDPPPSSGIIEDPITQKFDLNVLQSGQYHFILSYGAINDTSTHVIIFATPEPGTILLLGLGLAGIGFVMRKRL